MDDPVSVYARQRSTHRRRTKMLEKPADLTEPGDLRRVQEDMLRNLARRPLTLAGNGNGAAPEPES